MALRRRRQHHGKSPRGTLLAFIALAIQAMLPFFLATEMARAANPAYTDSIPICSSLGHHGGGAADDQSPTGNCPVCAAVAAGQSFTATVPLAVPMPRVCGRVDLSVAPLDGSAFVVSSPYQSRGPPSIA